MINLMQGDCLERMKDIKDGSIDMVLTDPPYGTTACKWDSIIPLEPMWEQLKRIIKPNGAIVMTASQPFTSVLTCSNLPMFKYCWAWDKVLPRGHLNAKKQPLRVIEDVCVFYAKQCTYNPQKTTGHKRKVARTTYNKKGIGEQVYGREKRDTFYDSTERYPKTLLQFSTANQSNKTHPTQKPVTLMEYLICTYTNEDETVLDFTMGSGSTGVACVNTNRNFIGIELDETYFNIAKNRINQMDNMMINELRIEEIKKEMQEIRDKNEYWVSCQDGSYGAALHACGYQELADELETLKGGAL
jgi:DNA modification methylase